MFRGLRKIDEEYGLGRFEVGRAVILHCYVFLKIDQFVGVKKVEGGIKCLPIEANKLPLGYKYAILA